MKLNNRRIFYFLLAFFALIAKVSAYTSDIGSALSLQKSRNSKITPLFKTSTSQYAYIASDSNHQIYICPIDGSGNLSSCTQTGTTPPGGSGTWSPYAIAFGTFSGSDYAYVADTSNGIQRCKVSFADGTLSACALTGTSYVTSGITGVSMAIVGSSQYLYVSIPFSGNVIKVCSFNSDGTINSCTSVSSPSAPFGGSAPWQPFEVAFATASGTQYAYVADQQNGAWQCSINSGNGVLSSCTYMNDSNINIYNTDNLGIATVDGGVKYAYLMPYFGSSFHKCIVESNGVLDTCATYSYPVGTTWSLPRSIAFATAGGNQYAYVGDITGHQVYKCAMDSSNGSFTSCSTTGPSSSDTTFMPRTMTTANFPAAHYTYKGSTSGHVNYVQLCNATDSTCSTCNAPFATVTAGTPISYSTSGTSYYINATAIAQYLTRAGASAGTYYVGMYVQSQELNCSAGSAYCATNHDNAGSPHVLCMTAVYDGAANVTSLTQTDNGTASLGSSTYQYAYISSDANNEMYVCPVESSGALDTCTEQGAAPPGGSGTWAPYASALGIFSGTTYAYVVDYGTGIRQCNVSATTGALSNCSTTGSSLASATGITIASVGAAQYAYIPTGSAVKKCSFNGDGTIQSCTTMSVSDGAVPFKVSFAYAGGVQYAYVADTTNGQWKCSLNISNGTFNTCTSTGVSNWASNGQAITTVSGTQYAYLTGMDTDIVYQCAVDANSGGLGSCGVLTSASSWSLPRSLTFTTVTGTTYAYIGDITGLKIVKCEVSGDGSFLSCESTDPSGGDSSFMPRTISIDSNYAYIASDSTHKIYICQIGAEGGLSSCSSAGTTPPGGAGTWNPYAVTFATFSGTKYAYVADASNGIYQCNAATPGTLSSCALTGGLGSGYVGITVATVGGTKYAYAAKAFSNIVKVCTFNIDGSIDICSTATGGDTPSRPAGSWQPYSIAFTSVGGTQYAYVADQQSGVWQCGLNTSDGSFFSVSDLCTYMSATPINPLNTDNIAVVTVGANQYAYMGAYSGRIIYRCLIDPDASPAGALDNCRPLNYPLVGANPRALDIATVSGIQYAYPADYAGNQLFQCPISNFNSCSTTSPTTAPVDTNFQPRDVTISYIRN